MPTGPSRGTLGSGGSTPGSITTGYVPPSPSRNPSINESAQYSRPDGSFDPGFPVSDTGPVKKQNYSGIIIAAIVLFLILKG